VDDLWAAFEHLIETAEVVIDRPRGSAHPRYPDCVYPLDYGHVADTTGGDGAEVDVWIGSDPGGAVVGLVVTADLHKRDVEVKLLIGCTAAESEIVRRFHDVEGQRALLVTR
jgi:inorganic pyrophosphatase